MLLVGNGSLDVARMQLHISEIFNPILQGEKFDKEGEYVKKWVPELRDLPKKFIHKPWELNGVNFKLGRDYPFPLVKHEEATSKALNAFKKI